MIAGCAYSLKSSAETVGATTLSSLASALETSASVEEFAASIVPGWGYNGIFACVRSAQAPEEC
jgi:HPt (histidine-containing phosphotransfer) domain-containing protein